MCCNSHSRAGKKRASNRLTTVLIFSGGLAALYLSVRAGKSSECTHQHTLQTPSVVLAPIYSNFFILFFISNHKVALTTAKVDTPIAFTRYDFIVLLSLPYGSNYINSPSTSSTLSPPTSKPSSTTAPDGSKSSKHLPLTF